MSTVPPIKFRCFQCNKLLGVSRSKINSVVTCPQCSSQLIVPDLAEPPETPESPPATRSPAPSPPRSSSGSQIEPVVVLWDKNPEPETEPASSGEQSVFPAIQVEPLSLRPDPPARLRTSTRPRAESWPETIDTQVAVPKIPAEVVPDRRREPTSPSGIAEVVKVDPPTIREDAAPSSASASPSLREPAARRNDVILPRTAVVLWSFLVLLGVVLAFTTGLLIGRFVWSSGVPVESAVVAPEPARTAG